MLGKPKINNLNFNIRKLEKPRRKEIKIRAEINEIENRKVIENTATLRAGSVRLINCSSVHGILSKQEYWSG